MADPFGCRCLTLFSLLRFHIPLVKPDMRFSRIRLSDKDSRGRPRKVAGLASQLEESQLLVQIPVGET